MNHQQRTQSSRRRHQSVYKDRKPEMVTPEEWQALSPAGKLRVIEFCREMDSWMPGTEDKQIQEYEREFDRDCQAIARLAEFEKRFNENFFQSKMEEYRKRRPDPSVREIVLSAAHGHQVTFTPVPDPDAPTVVHSRGAFPPPEDMKDIIQAAMPMVNQIAERAAKANAERDEEARIQAAREKLDSIAIGLDIARNDRESIDRGRNLRRWWQFWKGGNR